MFDGMPQGFLLSEAALYSFLDQDVYPDLISFAAAIPPHLRPLFLIPISVSAASSPESHYDTASRVASVRYADSIPSGQTPEQDLFGAKTFVYDENESTVPSSDPGSIFEVDGAGAKTHHQDLEQEQDQNYQVPTDTSYMSDVDVTDSYIRYPYRSEEHPRHSSLIVVARALGRGIKVALKPDDLEGRAPDNIKENAEACSVRLVSYDKRGRVFTFTVNCGNGAKSVRAALTDIDHIAMSCSCPFWRWNGPEFHAEANSYILGKPSGTAGPPDVRDPDRKYFLCKHAYSVLARMDSFVQQVVDDNWDSDDEGLMKVVDQEWDKLAEEAKIDLDEAQTNDVDVDWEEPESEEPEVEPAELESEEKPLDPYDVGEAAPGEPTPELEEEEIEEELKGDDEELEELEEEGPDPEPEPEEEDELDEELDEDEEEEKPVR